VVILRQWQVRPCATWPIIPTAPIRALFGSLALADPPGISPSGRARNRSTQLPAPVCAPELRRISHQPVLPRVDFLGFLRPHANALQGSKGCQFGDPRPADIAPCAQDIWLKPEPGFGGCSRPDMWHGTVPFRAGGGGGRKDCPPFDIVGGTGARFIPASLFILRKTALGKIMKQASAVFCFWRRSFSVAGPAANRPNSS